MAPTAADVLIEAIQDRGVEVVFGLPGDGINGIMVLAITGMPYHDLIGTHTQQDVALDQLFADVAKFNQRIMGVAHLTFPVDIQEMDAGAYRSKRNIKHHTSDVYARSARLPAGVRIDEAYAVFPKLRQYLARSLPDYMVPAAFTPVNSLPLTPPTRSEIARIGKMESMP